MMFLTKKHISRRTVLKSATTTLALPLLDAMIPAATALAQTAASPKPRFVGCFVPHGAAPGYWVPEKVGGLDPTLPFNWRPLEPFVNQTVILSGLHSRSAEPPPGATGADHWVAAAFMCAEKPKKTTGADIRAGTTIDQIIAQKIGGESLIATHWNSTPHIHALRQATSTVPKHAKDGVVQLIARRPIGHRRERKSLLENAR